MTGVNGPMVDLLHDAESGLLARAVRLGVAEVDTLVGPKGQHNPSRTAVRHGAEEGYVYVGDHKVPVTHPRVRTVDGDEVPLATYQAFQDPTLASQAVLERTLAGPTKTQAVSGWREFVGGVSRSL